MAMVERLRQASGGEVLLMRADRICGTEHVLSAVKHAERAFQLGKNSADGIAMETMLYASGERQLAKARVKMAARPGEEEMVVVLFKGRLDAEDLEELGMARDDEVLHPNVEKLRQFGIAPSEINAVPNAGQEDLVLERVAFVDILKR